MDHAAGPSNRPGSAHAPGLLCPIRRCGGPRGRRRGSRRCIGPVGILPPDQYLALVLQATEGCSFNTCTFCDLYQHPYRVKTADEFRAHVGGRARLPRRVGRSAVARDLPRRRQRPGGADGKAAVRCSRCSTEEADALRRGVYAFVDGFTGRLKDDEGLPPAGPAWACGASTSAWSPGTIRCSRSCASPARPRWPSRRFVPSKTPAFRWASSS